MIKYVRRIRPASGKPRSAALANKKQEKFDQICADNFRRNGVRIYRQEYTVKKVLKLEHLKNLETAANLNKASFSVHVNNALIHLMA
jgi:hypothetical protein